MREYIESIAGPIPNQDWNLYKEHLSVKTARKGEIILSFDKRCSSIWHMIKGAVRKFELDNGVEKTTHFYVAPKIFTVLDSALTGKLSGLAIVCEEDCEFLVLDIKKLQHLYQQSQYIERIGRRLVEEEFIEEFSLRRMFLKLDAGQRYEYMEKNHPDIMQRFQLKDLATFLGVTPESLSRLRKVRHAV